MHKKEYLEALVLLRERVKNAPFSATDRRSYGSRSVRCSWGLCGITDKEPDGDQKCPNDSAFDDKNIVQFGCYYRCRFMHLFNQELADTFETERRMESEREFTLLRIGAAIK